MMDDKRLADIKARLENDYFGNYVLAKADVSDFLTADKALRKEVKERKYEVRTNLEALKTLQESYVHESHRISKFEAENQRLLDALEACGEFIELHHSSTGPTPNTGHYALVIDEQAQFTHKLIRAAIDAAKEGE